MYQWSPCVQNQDTLNEFTCQNSAFKDIKIIVKHVLPVLLELYVTVLLAHGFSKLSFMQVFIMKIPQALLHFWVLPSNLGEIPWTGVAGGTFLKLWFVWCKLCNLYYTLRSRPMEPWLILLIIRYSVHCVIPHNIEITLWRNLSVLSRKCNY